MKRKKNEKKKKARIELFLSTLMSKIATHFEHDQGLNAENATTELWPPNPKEFEMPALDFFNICKLGATLRTGEKMIFIFILYPQDSSSTYQHWSHAAAFYLQRYRTLQKALDSAWLSIIKL